MSLLRLRPGVHYAPVDGGVYFSSARSTFVVRGPTVLFRVVDICLPRLEDGADVDGLVAAIGVQAARPLVSHLVDTLDSRGLVLHLDRLQTPEPEPADRDRFPEALAYLETHRDDPYGDFRRIRRARVLLAGPAEALGPAARGLLRAGAGQVMIATPEPDRLSGLASRHPEVRLLLDGPGEPPEAAVIFSEDGFPAEAIAHLPVTCVAVPVRLGKDLAIVGPAMSAADDQRAAEQLWQRAVHWSGLDGDDLLVRPSSDLLAGALAGQAAFDALVGLHPERVHVVHGPDLSSEAIAPGLSSHDQIDPPAAAGATDPDEGSGTTEPDEGSGATDPDAAAEGDWVASLSARWSGLFRIAVPDDLPQMPLALTLAEGRSDGFESRLVGFGPDQETSTREAALDALRRHCAAVLPPAPQPAVSAAAVDQRRWFLDGALRLLADTARMGSEDPVDPHGLRDAELRRMWRTVEEHELTPIRLSRLGVSGFGWPMVSVHDRRRGVRLAGGWGPTEAVAAQAAVSSALATLQLRRSVDPGFRTPVDGPGFVGYLHDPYLEDLAAQVESWLAAIGRRLWGQRLRRDPAAGPVTPFCGSVWLDD